MFRYLRLPMTILAFTVLSSAAAGSAFAGQRRDSHHRHDYHGQCRYGWYDRSGHFHCGQHNWYHRS